MAKPSVKKVAKIIMNECMGFAFDDIFPSAVQEAGPVESDGKTASFSMEFHRQRGTPKMYRVTVTEIY